MDAVSAPPSICLSSLRCGQHAHHSCLTLPCALPGLHVCTCMHACSHAGRLHTWLRLCSRSVLACVHLCVCACVLARASMCVGGCVCPAGLLSVLAHNPSCQGTSRTAYRHQRAPATPLPARAHTDDNTPNHRRSHQHTHQHRHLYAEQHDYVHSARLSGG